MKNKKIEAAEGDYERAAKKLTATIEQEYPVGSLLFVEKGRSTFCVKVLEYPDNWSWPTEIFGVNTATGKMRKFWPFSVVSVQRKGP